jgi:hypothetical protein
VQPGLQFLQTLFELRHARPASLVSRVAGHARGTERKSLVGGWVAIVG